MVTIRWIGQGTGQDLANNVNSGYKMVATVDGPGLSRRASLFQQNIWFYLLKQMLRCIQCTWYLYSKSYRCYYLLQYCTVMHGRPISLRRIPFISCWLQSRIIIERREIDGERMDSMYVYASKYYLGTLAGTALFLDFLAYYCPAQNLTDFAPLFTLKFNKSLPKCLINHVGISEYVYCCTSYRRRSHMYLQ